MKPPKPPLLKYGYSEMLHPPSGGERSCCSWILGYAVLGLAALALLIALAPKADTASASESCDCHCHRIETHP